MPCHESVLTSAQVSGVEQGRAGGIQFADKSIEERLCGVVWKAPGVVGRRSGESGSCDIGVARGIDRNGVASETTSAHRWSRRALGSMTRGLFCHRPQSGSEPGARR